MFCWCDGKKGGGGAARMAAETARHCTHHICHSDSCVTPPPKHALGLVLSDHEGPGQSCQEASHPQRLLRAREFLSSRTRQRRELWGAARRVALPWTVPTGLPLCCCHLPELFGCSVIACFLGIRHMPAVLLACAARSMPTTAGLPAGPARRGLRRKSCALAAMPTMGTGTATTGTTGEGGERWRPEAARWLPHRIAPPTHHHHHPAASE